VSIDGIETSVESAYQSSKVFENGGPYLDLLNCSSMEAKQDQRLKNSGRLLNFAFADKTWPIRRAPNLYDFLYIRGLLHSNDHQELLHFNAFTDIAFSQVSLDYKHGRSYNCQARSAAIFHSLSNRMEASEMLDYLQIQGLEAEGSTEQLDLF
jgi:type I restriction enzyme M protein